MPDTFITQHSLVHRFLDTLALVTVAITAKYRVQSTEYTAKYKVQSRVQDSTQPEK